MTLAEYGNILGGQKKLRDYQMIQALAQSSCSVQSSMNQIIQNSCNLRNYFKYFLDYLNLTFMKDIQLSLKINEDFPSEC